MLTKDQAEQLVVATLKCRFENQSVSIAVSRTVERAFGWAFVLAADGLSPVDGSPANLPLQVVVNKYSEQIVASSIGYSAELFIELYEEFLAENQALGGEWCITVAFPHPSKNRLVQRLAKKWKEAGFYEVNRNSRGP